MSLSDRVKADHGVLVVVNINRFRSGDWFAGQKCTESCSTCGSNLLVYRRPYTTSVGKQYHYWGIVCLGCKKAFHPDELEESKKKRIYKTHRITPLDIGATKELITKYLCILANSVKQGKKCIAGIEIIRNQKCQWKSAGCWIRPISHRPGGAISDTESFLKNKKEKPELFDVVEVPLLRPANIVGQPEDWLIEESHTWVYHGNLNPRIFVGEFLERPKNLWLQQNEKRDRVTPEWLAKYKLPSLYLVKPERLKVYVRESDFGFGKKRSRRAFFCYNGVYYDFGMTDPIASQRHLPDYQSREAGTNHGTDINCAALCVSLAPEWKRDLDSKVYHFKLVAAIIERE